MKLSRFTFDSSWSSGHIVTVTEPNGLDVRMTDFQPSDELIAMIEKEAEAEIQKRRGQV